MGQSVNKVVLIGRLGKDPVVRDVNGKVVANFSIATDESYKDRNGEKVKKTEWHNLVVWGNVVTSFIEPYVHSGDLVYVEGKLQTRKWTDNNQVERYSTEINVSDIRLLVSQNQGDSSSAAKGQPQTQRANGQQQQRATGQRAQQTRQAQPPSRQVNQQVADEDIPF
jgi:single-strand DNA-binding protein